MAQPAQTTLTERILRREQTIIALALAVIVILAWVYVLLGAGTGMSTVAMTTWRFPPPRPAAAMMGEWSPSYWATMLAMWWVMMIAMMVPSAAPAIMLHARIIRHGQARGHFEDALVPSAAFAGGYLVAWLGFSLLAVGVQFALERYRLLHGMLMWSTDRHLTAGLLVAAGLYQITPLKAACLGNCRSPAAFIARHWRPGRAGAFRMGLAHGTYCVGCCWALMLLLFAAGIMNLVWIAGLAVLVLLEKLAPFGSALTRPLGALLVAAGVAVLVVS